MDIGPPKSPASVRTVALPNFLAQDLRQHLAEHAQSGKDGLLFVGDRGGVLRRGNFRRATHWKQLVRKAGLPEDSTSITCGIPATSSPPSPGRARRS